MFCRVHYYMSDLSVQSFVSWYDNCSAGFYQDHVSSVGHSSSGRCSDSQVTGQLAGVGSFFGSGFAVEGQGPGSV